jgi:putative addiction module component (TIGR02574 family)
MVARVSTLLHDALTLPDDERAELAAELLASLDPAPTPGVNVDDAWRDEIDRRVHAALSGEPGVPWEEVKANLARRLSGG